MIVLSSFCFKAFQYWRSQTKLELRICFTEFKIILCLVMVAPHAGANARLQLLLENSKSKKGHNYVKMILRVTSPIGMGYPFQRKPNRVSFK